jgi:hypothetical protein
MAPLFNETDLGGQEEKEEVKIREAREYYAHGSMAKILCEVSWGGAQLSLLYLPSEEQRNPFPFKLFECIHGEAADKIVVTVLQGTCRLCPFETVNAFPHFCYKLSMHRNSS